MATEEDGQSLASDYDNVMSYIGQFGAFQKKVFFLMWLVAAAAGLTVVVFSFTGYKQQYRCPVQQCEAYNSSFYSASLSSKGKPQLPSWVDKSTINSCQRCTEVDNNCNIIGNTTSTCLPADLIYDTSIMASTVVKDLQFVCGDSYKHIIYSTIYMFGMLIGSYFCGFISDTFGRIKALILVIIFASLPGFLGAFCIRLGFLNGFGFLILRFISGMGGIGCILVSFVLAVEYVGYKFTMFIGVTMHIPYALGQLLLGIEAYLIRDWTMLQTVVHLPILALLGFWFLVPESPRWLLSRGRIDEAAAIIRRMAEANERPVPEHLFKDASLSGEGDRKKKMSALDLIKCRKMALRTVNMCFQWFSINICYYGLSFASTSLSGDRFLNFCLTIFIEIPGCIFCLVVMDSWGRRPLLVFCQGSAGIACILTGFLHGIPSFSSLQIFASLIGKFMASASLAVVYVYTAEMFPTGIRSRAIGTCCSVAKIGMVCSTLLGLMEADYPNYPAITMGIVASVAGGLAVLFPETLGQKLPDTMEEAFRIGDDNKRSLFTWKSVNYRDIFKEDLRQVPTTATLKQTTKI